MCELFGRNERWSHSSVPTNPSTFLQMSAGNSEKIATFFPQVPFFTFQLNWRIFVATFVLAVVFGLFSGVWPAWKMSRQHPVLALRGGAS